jgi:hypothetical protein
VQTFENTSEYLAGPALSSATPRIPADIDSHAAERGAAQVARSLSEIRSIAWVYSLSQHHALEAQAAALADIAERDAAARRAVR